MEGIDLGVNIILELAKKTPMEEIAAKYNTSVKRVEKISDALKQVPK